MTKNTKLAALGMIGFAASVGVSLFSKIVADATQDALIEKKVNEALAKNETANVIVEQVKLSE